LRLGPVLLPETPSSLDVPQHESSIVGIDAVDNHLDRCTPAGLCPSSEVLPQMNNALDPPCEEFPCGGAGVVKEDRRKVGRALQFAGEGCRFGARVIDDNRNRHVLSVQRNAVPEQKE
jgi:hypothetical protein